METLNKEQNRINNINNTINTNMLIDYLEGIIADEMILNSFIRDIKIVNVSNTLVTISVESLDALNYINSNYKNQFTDGVRSVFEKELDFNLVLIGYEIDDKDHSDLPSHQFINKKFTFDNFVEGSYNKESLMIVKKIIKKLGKFSPIFITSKSGLGKTHILHATGNELIKNNHSCMYVEPNKFTKDITELSKIGGDSITNYVESLKKYDVLLFDDIQNLGERAVTLKVLFEILNTFIENEKQIIIASDKSPNELSGFESRFITRFSSGITTTLKTPSLNDLIKILEFKLDQEDLNPEKWEKEALQFIARNNSTSIRSIEGAVKRVSFFLELDSNTQYTFAVVSNIFKELTINPVELTPSRVINTVASYYKINKSDIIGKSRKKNIVLARHMAIWLVRKILNIPYKEIGKIFGNKDHSTIMSSIKVIDKKMLLNNVVKLAADKIEEKIKSNS